MSERHLSTEDLLPPDDRPVNEGYQSEEPVTDELPVEETVSEQTNEQRAPLFESDEIDRFREDWRALQSDFVDNPREAVQQADELVAQVMQNLAATFAEHKHSLEVQWAQGDEVQTEDLRLALQQYRTFFHQLLAVR